MGFSVHEPTVEHAQEKKALLMSRTVECQHCTDSKVGWTYMVIHISRTKQSNYLCNFFSRPERNSARDLPALYVCGDINREF